jgi:four helix bundle protein
MRLEDLEVYQRAMRLGEQVWHQVSGWEAFHRDTIGKQVVRSCDSVAANVSEGFGRFHYNDSKRFYYYARGSLQETKTWLAKAHRRGLVDGDAHAAFRHDIDTLSVKLNNYIRSIGPAQRTS